MLWFSELTQTLSEFAAVGAAPVAIAFLWAWSYGIRAPLCSVVSLSGGARATWPSAGAFGVLLAAATLPATGAFGLLSNSLVMAAGFAWGILGPFPPRPLRRNLGTYMAAAALLGAAMVLHWSASTPGLAPVLLAAALFHKEAVRSRRLYAELTEDFRGLQRNILKLQTHTPTNTPRSPVSAAVPPPPSQNADDKSRKAG